MKCLSQSAATSLSEKKTEFDITYLTIIANVMHFEDACQDEEAWVV